MPSRRALLVAIVAVVCVAFATLPLVSAGGGGECAGCTLLVDLIEKIAVQEAGGSVKQAIDFLCGNFNLPGESAIKKVCEGLAVVAAVPLQLALEAGETPDVTCQTGGLKFLNMCSPADVANQCRLFSAPVRERAAHTFRASSAAAAAASSSSSSSLHERQSLVQTVSWHLRMFASLLGGGGAGLGPAPATAVKSAPVAGGKVAAGKPKHTPALDLDSDYFSVLPTLRGSDWRGKDCNDIDANIYPGSALNLQGPNIDHNCNGISGVDASQRSYEDAFCGGPNAPRGTIVIGDSASAHFGIPPQYLMPDNQNGSMVYANLVSFAENEADWPQCSWATAHANDTECPPHSVPINSVYQRMRARNLCSHRDFQNIGVNGANTDNVMPPDGSIMSLARSKKDAPANVFFSLIGNDVCSSEHDFNRMRTPTDFAAYVTASLQYLDTVLPQGSAVLFVPLVDGRVLYDHLHSSIHPVGVTYADVYDYLNCLNTSPCWGWMNTNETVRNMTTQHAQALSAVYPQLVASQKYDSFTMHALSLDWHTIFDKWVAAGRDPAELIEPVDGFHPSTTGSQVMAEEIWNEVAASWPDLLGPVNPNNAAIQAMFGAQGGY